jgi:hypothetical protein
VVGAGAVENVADAVVVTLGPLLEHGGTILDNTSPNGEQADSDDGLLVHDIVLVAEGVDAEAGGTTEKRALGDDVVTGEGLDDALSLLLRLLGGHVARVADGGGRAECGESSASDGRSEEGSAGSASRQTRSHCDDEGSAG